MTVETRLTRLESDAFQASTEARTQAARLGGLEGAVAAAQALAADARTQAAAVTEQTAHHGNAIGTLSQDLRALTHEVRTEVVPRLDRIEARLDDVAADVATLKSDVATLKTGMAALLAHFDIAPPAPPEPAA